jgi:hypothetical protein
MLADVLEGDPEHETSVEDFLRFELPYVVV